MDKKLIKDYSLDNAYHGNQTESFPETNHEILHTMIKYDWRIFLKKVYGKTIKIRNLIPPKIKSRFLYTQRKIYRYYIETNSDYRNSLVLAGTLRSGTTWISDLINYKNEYRYILDPFHPLAVNISKHFKWRQYLRPGNQNPIYLKPTKLFFSGKIRYKWTDRDNRRLICRKRMIKTNFATLLLGWFKSHFPEVPIILVLRHPCAVVNSMLKVTSRPILEEYLSQKALMTDFLNPFRKEIEQAHSLFEKYIFQWCFETYVPLKQFQPGEIHVVFYENMCNKPLLTIKKLFSFLREDVDQRIFFTLKKPSSTCRRDSPIKKGTSLIDSWRNNITTDQTQRAIQILSLFGLDKIYSNESMPKIDKKKVFQIF